MPLAKRPTKRLPGTDPRFHEQRLYMSPVTYKGKHIIAYHASCKESGCKFSSAWTSNQARELGIWKHRSSMVNEARRDHFVKEYSGDLARIEKAILHTADKHSDTFENWADKVWTIYRGRTGVLGEIELENPQLRVDYHMGLTAHEVASKIYAENYDA